MKMYVKNMKVYGDNTDVTIYPTACGDEWVRFMVTGSWDGPQDTSAAGKDMCVQLMSDGSFTITKQKLIPVSYISDERQLNELTDMTLNAIEDALDLNTMSLSSGSTWVGHNSADMDYLMTNEERAIISSATQHTAIDLSFGPGVFSIGTQKFAENGESYTVNIYANVSQGKTFLKDDIKAVLARFGYGEKPASFLYHEYGRDYANMTGWDGVVQATYNINEKEG